MQLLRYAECIQSYHENIRRENRFWDVAYCLPTQNAMTYIIGIQNKTNYKYRSNYASHLLPYKVYMIKEKRNRS